MQIFISHSLDETLEFGRNFAHLLAKGDVIALYGELGAGKTSLVKGFAAGLKVRGHVTSPTFTLIQEYRGILPMYHFDCYRLNSIEEFLQLGPDEYFFGDGVCLIEWAEKIEALLPANRYSIRIEYTDPVGFPQVRKITVFKTDRR